MSFVRSVNGRSVIPVRALPWVTGRDGERWHLDAVEIARALACDKGFTDFAAVRAWGSDGVLIDLDEWRRLVEKLKARRAERDWHRDEWQLHATLMLPAGAYVDAEAWRDAYEQCSDGPGSLLAALHAPDAEWAGPTKPGPGSAEDRAEAAARALDYGRAVPAAVAELIAEGFDTPATLADGHPRDETASLVGPLLPLNSTAETPRERRAQRVRRLRELGGDYVRHGDTWLAVGRRGATADLQREESAAGRPMSRPGDLRRDLEKAFELEADRRANDGQMTSK
jgi:hypothetical protein